MASVNARGGFLFFDLRIAGRRCREYTRLEDTPANRRKMEAVLKKIEEDLALGTFEYGRYFPHSRTLSKLNGQVTAAAKAPDSSSADESAVDSPLFENFAQLWRDEKSVEWRKSYLGVIDGILTKHLIPGFKGRQIGQIDRALAMSFRTDLARQTVDEKGEEVGLDPSTVNRIMGVLHGTTNPVPTIKRLKVRRKDIFPFTLEETRQLIETVRADYRDYLLFRFFTGVRPGEAHGLKWSHVDFDRRLVMIRETFAKGRTEYTKNDASQRDISMSQPVFDALQAQKKRTGDRPEGYVFCGRDGKPIDNHNFDFRVWRPLLRHLRIKDRRPYQMRHTCATLWLAAGENPEWIAQQLGHANTEMLFRVYSRYVPNLTRQDGSAFDRLLAGALNHGVHTTETRQA
jgi:integrase